MGNKKQYQWKKGVHTTLSLSMILSGLTLPSAGSLFLNENVIHASTVDSENPVDFNDPNIKALMEAVIPQWRDRVVNIDIARYNVTWDEMSAIIKKVHYNYPELYYIFGAANPIYRKNTSAKKYVDRLEMDYRMDRSAELEEEWQKVKEKLQYAKTDIEKILVVHDHLCETVMFSENLGNTSHDIEGSILEKKAVCEGYALAFKFYMNKLNIECEIVTGVAGGSNEFTKAPHAWNEVKLDGQWYMVDATYDDTREPKITQHSYFLKSEYAGAVAPYYKDSFLTTHIIDRDGYYPCTDRKYDDAFWTPLNKEITPYNGKLIYSGRLEKPAPDADFFDTVGVIIRDLKTGEEQMYENVREPWKERENDTSVVYTYSATAVYKDYLYFSTPKAIWKRDLTKANSEKELVYELKGEDAKKYIWDIKIENGRVYYDAAIEKPGIREYSSVVIDDSYQKRTQPLAINKKHITIPLSVDEVFVNAAAPNTIEYKMEHLDIATSDVVYGDYSCRIKPVKEGKTKLHVTALENDRYLANEQIVEIDVVKANSDIRFGSASESNQSNKRRFNGSVYVSREGSGTYQPTGTVTFKVFGDGTQLHTQTYNLDQNHMVNYDFSVQSGYKTYTVEATYEGDARFKTSKVTKQFGEVSQHTHTFVEKEDAKYLKSDADCEHGRIYYKSCACGEKSSQTFERGSALGHAYSQPQWTWSGTRASAMFTCSRNHNHTKVVQANVTSERVSNPTCTTKGSTRYIASVELDGRTYSDSKIEYDIKELNHEYGEPTWHWNQNQAKATFTCKHDHNHKEQRSANMTSRVLTPATCTTKGTTRYVGTVAFNGKSFTTQKDVQNIAMKQHNYVNGVCTTCKAKDPNAVKPQPPKPQPEIPKPQPQILKGDVNQDGKVSAIDLLEVEKYIVYKTPLNEAQLKAADVNGDGKITAIDLLKIEKHIVYKKPL